MEDSPSCVGLLDRHVLDVMKLGQFAKQATQGGPFAGLQAIEELAVVPVRDLRQLGKNAVAAPRQGKQLDAAVAWLGGARDPVLRFEFADDLGDGATRQIQGFGEVPGGNPRPFLDSAQHHPFGNGGVPGLQRTGECAGDVIGNAAQPISEVKLKVR